MDEQLRKLHRMLDSVLNLAPIEEDCTDEGNNMYSDMANLKNSMFILGYGKEIQKKGK